MNSDTKRQLLDKLNSHIARIAVIGLGYVGLAVAFAEAGLPIIGIDVDASKVNAINAGRSTTSDISSESLAQVGVWGQMAGRSPVRPVTLSSALSHYV